MVTSVLPERLTKIIISDPNVLETSGLGFLYFSEASRIRFSKYNVTNKYLWQNIDAILFSSNFRLQIILVLSLNKV